MFETWGKFEANFFCLSVPVFLYLLNLQTESLRKLIVQPKCLYKELIKLSGQLQTFQLKNVENQKKQKTTCYV